MSLMFSKNELYQASLFSVHHPTSRHQSCKRHGLNLRPSAFLPIKEECLSSVGAIRQEEVAGV